MKPEGTMRKRCWRCKKLVLVPNPTPCLEESRIFLSGIWLSTMNENLEEKTIGVLCFECAFVDSWNGEEHDLVLGFSGGVSSNLDFWDALIRIHKETEPLETKIC